MGLVKIQKEKVPRIVIFQNRIIQTQKGRAFMWLVGSKMALIYLSWLMVLMDRHLIVDIWFFYDGSKMGKNIVTDRDEPFSF